METDAPTRYVVLVWFHDQWSVNAQADDFGAAESAFDSALRHDKSGLRPILLDTQMQSVMWTDAGEEA